MNRTEKIQALESRLDSLLRQSRTDTLIDDELEAVRNQVVERVRSRSLEQIRDDILELRKEITSVRDGFTLEPAFVALEKAVDGISGEIEKARGEVDSQVKAIKSEFEKNVQSLASQLEDGNALSSVSLQALEAKLNGYQETYANESKDALDKGSFLSGEIGRISEEVRQVMALIESKDDEKDKKAIEDAVKELEKRLNTRINSIQQHGGGNANRSIVVNGDKDTLKYYTDINLKPGSNVTITYAKNIATKYTDITISATGGGGGTSRSVNNISTNTAAGSTAGTDYVYICSAALTLTLPPASGNSNLYTVKNNSNGTITINTTGGDTIDSDTNLQLPLRFTSVDLISDGVSNWNIT